MEHGEGKDIESPAGKGMFKPGDAKQLPTKHYPASSKLGHEGKKATIDGPCNEYKK